MIEDEINRMPWTRSLMTDAELQAWVASRKEAGAAIDIETCEHARWRYDLDPYEVNLGALRPQMRSRLAPTVALVPLDLLRGFFSGAFPVFFGSSQRRFQCNPSADTDFRLGF
jgi:hypothetical protein